MIAPRHALLALALACEPKEEGGEEAAAVGAALVQVPAKSVSS